MGTSKSLPPPPPQKHGRNYYGEVHTPLSFTVLFYGPELYLKYLWVVAGESHLFIASALQVLVTDCIFQKWPHSWLPSQCPLLTRWPDPLRGHETVVEVRPCHFQIRVTVSSGSLGTLALGTQLLCCEEVQVTWRGPARCFSLQSQRGHSQHSLSTIRHSSASPLPCS